MPKHKYHTEEERKQARKEAYKRWAAKNKDKIAAYGKVYRSDPAVKARYAQHQQNWRNKNPERYKEIDRLSYQNTRQHNRVSRLLAAAKERAKQKGLEFDITHSDIIIPDYCPVLGIKLERGNGRTRPELDRRDNSRGYVKGNVFVISGRANRIKADASVEELQALLRYMVP